LEQAELQARFEAGIDLLRSMHYEQAVECFAALIDQKHDWAEAHYRLGLAQHHLGRLEDAGDSFALALCFAPAMACAHHALALTERKRGKLDAALASVEQSIEGGLRQADTYNLKGALLLDRGDVPAAVASFEQAVAIAPESASAHGNLGYVLFRDCGEYERGAHHIERALQLDPANIDCQCNYSMVLSQRGEQARALELCDRILARQPDMHEARLNRALVLLKLGRYEEGWADYEARKAVRCNYLPRRLPWPEWRGESLANKVVLIHGEQGLGDEIMFASCFPDIIAKANHCVIECAPPLVSLFQHSFPAASVFAGQQSIARPEWANRAPAIDMEVSAGSLPLHFRRTPESFPSHSGYLAPDPARTAYWRNRLGALGPGLKVGISWRGGMPSTRRNLRSIELPQWLPLLQTPGARFVSLQYGDAQAECTRFVQESGAALACWPEATDDIGETAALVGALDLVISVCTAVVHLAGAIGRPVWILVPTCPEWRYGVDGGSMMWYPSAVLMRQESPGDWRPVMAEATRRLRHRIEGSGGDGAA
jgi:Tfp pilus assembly protein PilF